MKKKVMTAALAAAVIMMSFSGCSSEEKKLFEQANKDLEQGSYEYALQEYKASIENEVNLAQSYRGAGIAQLRMGNYAEAVESFTSALGLEKVEKTLRHDLLKFRASAEYKMEEYEMAMSDCQTIAAEFEMDADDYYLTGKTALALDAYAEASTNFTQAYANDATYDMAIQIYQAYTECDMEADGTKYLETALLTEAKTADDYCDRGLAYYYMEDYESAGKELITASNMGSTEAEFYLGMVYFAKNDTANARAMYQQYIDDGGSAAKGYNGLAMCEMKEKNYDSALEYITSGIATASTEELQNLMFNEVVVYEKQLDFVTALSKAEEYLRIFSDDEVMQKELEFLKTRV